MADLQFAIDSGDDLHVRQGLVGANRAQRHGQGFDIAQRQGAFGKQAVSQALRFVQTQINQHAAAACLSAGADAFDFGNKGLGAIFDFERCRLSQCDVDGVAGAHGHFNLELAQVDHLQHFAVDGDALASLCRTNGDLSRKRRIQHRVIQRFLCHIRACNRRLVAGNGALVGGLRVVQCRFGNKAFIDQSFVGVPLALRNFHLRFGRVRLLLGLRPTALVFGRINAREHLSGLDAVALAHRHFFEFTSNASFDDGVIEGFDGA